MRLRIFQHDEPAVGLRKDRKQAVQELGQDLGHRQRPAEVLADLDQGLELAAVFRSSRRPVDTATFEVTVDSCTGRSSSIIIDFVRLTPAPAGWRHPMPAECGSPAAEWKRNYSSQMSTLSLSASNCRCVTGRPFNSVPLRLCRSSMIEIAGEMHDSGVLPAHRARFEHDIAGRVPTEDDRLPLQWVQLARFEPFDRLEHGHAYHPNVGQIADLP